MEINNVFSPVPFYKNKKYWHSNKWYTYGQKCPIMMTSQNTLPFQLVVDSGVTLSSFTIKKADNDTVVRTVSTSGNYFNIAGESYNVIQIKACAISVLPYGNYYYALTLSDGSTYISDIIAIISDMSKCIKITYKNVENLYFSSGHIDFTNDFVFELYLPTTIGKPEYEYEEELTKRLGYKFVESQVVNKVYKFTFPATEQLCDAYRFVRMCDYIRIDTYNPDFSDYDHYNIIYLSSEVEWLDNGDIASVETSFETDSIVQKLQDYSRTQLVNFYNALLSNSDEALKFDDETIAQYYNNYIQSIDGKMIRQLNAVSSISDNTVIAIDENNGTGAANKILLKPLLVNTVAEQLQASEVLANFQQHINNSAIHITAAERAVLSLFGVDDNGDVYVKGDKGFYTNSFVSAKGKSSSAGGGGASALYQLVDVLANENNDGVQGATANSVLMYNGTKWYAGTIGAGASGTWGISITGNAATATNADKLDGYHLTPTSSSYVNPWNTVPVIKSDGVMEIGRYLDFHFDNTSNLDYSCRLQTNSNSQNVVKLPSTSGTLALVEGSVAYATSAGNADTVDNEHASAFAHIGAHNNLIASGNEFTFASSGFSGIVYINYRTAGGSNGNITEYRLCNGAGSVLGTAIHTGNYNSYSPTLTGTGASGTWGINISGNAATATRLQTPRTIWGQSFDGTGNVSGNVDIGGSDIIGYGGARILQNLGNNLGINPIGNVGIGTTSPSVKLHVIGDIAATGAVTAKASSSDIRLKTDITDYKALSIIRNHKSIKYHWNAVAKANADIFNDDYWHYGLIAQDVQRDMPQMVSDVFKDYLVINYERLIPICWKGLQEVDDEVTKLKKKVRKLEMEIRELKQKEDRL